MQLGKSMTPVVRLFAFQSVENVSGQKPAFMMRVDRVPSHMAGLPVADVEPDAAAARRQHLRQDVAAVVDDAVGRRREHVRDDVAALQQIDQLGKRRDRLAHVDHHRQIEGAGDLLRAPQHLVVVRAGDVARQPRLDADDRSRGSSRSRRAPRATSARAEVHRVAVGQDAGAPDVDQHAARLRRRSWRRQSCRRYDRRPAIRRRSNR